MTYASVGMSVNETPAIILPAVDGRNAQGNIASVQRVVCFLECLLEIS